MTLRAKQAGPLAGLVVIDLTRILAGPYCTMVLSDLGARVIKVERPGTGDDARHYGPFIGEQSAYFFSVNRNKESIALDLKHPADRAIFERLLKSADVLVENFRPGTLDKLGYGWEGLRKTYTGLVLASISGFGQTGPYRALPAYDIVVQAMGGIMSLTGQPGGLPTRVGVSIGDITAGLFAAIAIQAALIRRVTTKQGAHVDVAMLDSQVALLENAVARYQATGAIPGPIGARHPSITPFGIFRAKDGWLVLAAGNDDVFQRLCDSLALPEIKIDSRFATNEARCENQEQLARVIEASLASQRCEEWLPHLMQQGIPCGPLNDVADVVADEQVRSRQMLVSLPIGGAGENLLTPGNPIKFVDENFASFDASPRLDEHRSAILAELGMSEP